MKKTYEAPKVEEVVLYTESVMIFESSANTVDKPGSWT